MKKGEKTKLTTFLYYAFPLIVAAVIAGFFIDAKTAMIILFSILLMIGYFIWKEGIGQEFLVAFLFAIGITSYHYYEYTTTNIIIGGINIFPLIAWTFGLVVFRELYEKVDLDKKLVIFTLAYIPLIAAVEYIGYNYLGIRLVTNYRGLFGLELIHTTLIMKAIYFTAGPIYLLVTDYLKVK